MTGRRVGRPGRGPVRAGAPAAATARVTGPGELLAVVPYLLGFAPSDSLVLVALAGSPPQVVLTERLALAAVERSDARARMLEAVRRSAGEMVVAVAYPGGPEHLGREHPGSLAAALDLFAHELADGGVRLLDLLLVRGRRWWSLLCGQPDCCPREGRALPPPGSTAAEAAFTLEGRAPLANRADLAARFETDVPAMGEVTRILESGDRPVDAPHAVSLADSLLAECSRRPCGPPGLPVEVAALLLTALRDVRVRDCLLPCVTGAGARSGLELWARLTQLAPPGHVADVATLAAAFAYLAGDGALAWLALDRAQGDQPGHVLSAQLSVALAHGLPPDSLREPFARAVETSRRRLDPHRARPAASG